MQQHLAQKPKTEPMHLTNFSKYDFVKEYTKNAKTAKQKAEKEFEAEIIADAIRKQSDASIENLVTREDLRLEIQGVRNEIQDVRNEVKDVRNEVKDVRKDLVLLEHKLTIKMAVIMGSILTLFKALEVFLGI